MNKRYRFLFFITIILLPLTVQAVIADWSPEEPNALYSRLDRPVFVQIAYGNLINEPVFIPHTVNIIPSPVFYVIMGGLAENEVKIASLDVYRYNTTTHEYSTRVNTTTNQIYLSINYSVSEFFAIKKIELDLNNTETYLCQFLYMDIYAEFYYKPDPLYVTFTTNQYFLYGWGVAMVLFTVIDLTVAAIAGRRIQRRTVTVPRMPVFEILSLTLAVLMFAASFLMFQFPYTGIDMIIHLLTGNTFYLVFPFLFVTFSLWFANRHSEDMLRTLQVDLSRFESREGEKKVRWIKDLANYYCYYLGKKLCLLKDPDDWRGFFGRFFGWHIVISNYAESMQPDEGKWTQNDRRVFVSVRDVMDFDGHFDLELQLDRFNIILFCLGTVLCFAGMGQILGSWVDYLLMLLGALVLAVGYLFKKNIFWISYKKGSWVMETNKYREAEEILTSQTRFDSLQDKITLLESEYNDAVANQEVQVRLAVRRYVETAEKALKMEDVIPDRYDRQLKEQEKLEEEKKRIEERVPG